MGVHGGRPAQTLLALLGGRVALIAVAWLALGWFVTAPLSIHRHATEEPFRVDYLAFDTAATIFSEGDAARLYEREQQFDVQKRRAGNDEPSYFVYLHPPVVGAMYLPLAIFDARTGYVVSAVMLALVMVGVGALFYQLLDGWPRRARLVACLCLLGSTATASAVISGQLTPFLLAGSGVALLAYRSGRIGLAGAALGLLVVKPHFAIAALVVLLLARQRKLAAGMGAVAGIAAVASLALVGFNGAAGYLGLIRDSFSHPASLYINVLTEQNLPGFLATAFGLYGGVWPRVGGALVLAIGLLLVRRAFANVDGFGDDRAHYVAAIAAAFMIATAPHIQFYDLGLLVFPAWFVLRRAAAYPADVRPRFFGLLVVLICCVEIAGMLSGAGLSVTFPALVALMLMLSAWPAVESWLAAPHRDALPVGRDSDAVAA